MKIENLEFLVIPRIELQKGGYKDWHILSSFVDRDHAMLARKRRGSLLSRIGAFFSSEKGLLAILAMCLTMSSMGVLLLANFWGAI